MQPLSQESPEARRQLELRGVRAVIDRRLSRLPPWTRVWEVLKRTSLGVYADGFIHAGNLAYLTLVTLFPFFIVTAALASLFGRGDDTMHAVSGFLATLPANVQAVVRQPILDVLNARTGWLLWLGAIVGLWTVGSYIETIRDILRRAYGTEFTLPFWRYRLTSSGITIASVVLVMVAFAAQVLLTAAEQFVYRLLPFAQHALQIINLSKLVPLVILFGALYALIWSLTPSRYRYADCPKWPGALFVALWWYLLLYLLPIVLFGLTNYALTYGSLAGVIVTLIFFWFVGLGFTFGAHLNAALAEPAAARLEEAAGSATEAA